MAVNKSEGKHTVYVCLVHTAKVVFGACLDQQERYSLKKNEESSKPRYPPLLMLKSEKEKKACKLNTRVNTV